MISVSENAKVLRIGPLSVAQGPSLSPALLLLLWRSGRPPAAWFASIRGRPFLEGQAALELFDICYAEHALSRSFHRGLLAIEAIVWGCWRCVSFYSRCRISGWPTEDCRLPPDVSRGTGGGFAVRARSRFPRLSRLLCWHFISISAGRRSLGALVFC